MRKVFHLLSVIIIASGCESMEKKAERLRSDQTIACFEASQPNTADQQAHDADPTYKQTPEQRRVTVDSFRVAIRAKCDLATRELNRFMR